MINEIKRRLDNGETVELECVDIDGFTNIGGEERVEANSKILSQDKLIVDSINPTGGVINLKGDLILDGCLVPCLNSIYGNEIKYFKIKENHCEPTLWDRLVINDKAENGKKLLQNFDRVTPEDFKNMHFENISQDDEEKTFDDLIDVAVQAYKDGTADKLEVGFDMGIERVKLHIDGDVNLYYQSKDIKRHIEHIMSYYTETFTIESKDDLSKIKEGATVTLSNGAVLESRTPKATPVTPTKGLTFIDDEGDYCFLKLQILKGAKVTQRRV